LIDVHLFVFFNGQYQQEDKFQAISKQLEESQLLLKVAETKNKVLEVQTMELQKQRDELKTKNEELEKQINHLQTHSSQSLASIGDRNVRKNDNQ
jgi:chromosome segregation ATPase